MTILDLRAQRDKLAEALRVLMACTDPRPYMAQEAIKATEMSRAALAEMEKP